MADREIYVVDYKGNPITGETVGELLRKAYRVDHPLERGEPSNAALSSWILRADIDQIKNVDYGE